MAATGFKAQLMRNAVFIRRTSSHLPQRVTELIKLLHLPAAIGQFDQIHGSVLGRLVTATIVIVFEFSCSDEAAFGFEK